MKSYCDTSLDYLLPSDRLQLWGLAETVRPRHTVYLVIFTCLTCLNFREFLILKLFTKFRICECSFFFNSAIIIIIFARFLNSRIVFLAKFAKIKTSQILPDLQYSALVFTHYKVSYYCRTECETSGKYVPSTLFVRPHCHQHPHIYLCIQSDHFGLGILLCISLKSISRHRSDDSIRADGDIHTCM